MTRPAERAPRRIPRCSTAAALSPDPTLYGRARGTADATYPGGESARGRAVPGACAVQICTGCVASESVSAGAYPAAAGGYAASVYCRGS
jgi:hypothetical protein